MTKTPPREEYYALFHFVSKIQFKVNLCVKLAIVSITVDEYLEIPSTGRFDASRTAGSGEGQMQRFDAAWWQMAGLVASLGGAVIVMAFWWIDRRIERGRREREDQAP